jgi:hypothetical protein
MNHLELIEAITLPELTTPVAPAAPPLREQARQTSAEINASCLLVFDSGLSRQLISDVSNSVLFSQLAADAKANRFTEAPAWSSRYFEVMGQIGWNQTKVRYNGLVLLPAPVDWIPVVTQNLDAGAALARAGIAAAQAMSQASEAMRFWNRNAFDEGRGLMMMAPTQLVSGSVVTEFGLTWFALERAIDGFLGWSLGYRIMESGTTMVLNEDVYAQVREAIIKKLGNRARDYVANVPM